MMTLLNSSMLLCLETVTTNERGADTGVRTATSQSTSETNVTFDAPGVNFYLRLGTIGIVVRSLQQP